MKKYLILALTAAIAAVGCTKTFEVAPTPETPIGFGVWTEHLTKAARTPGSSSFTEDGYLDNDFAVYGFKTRASGAPTTVTVFDDVVVSTTDGATWTYSPKRIWDTGYDSYTFYAVSPASIGTAATVDPQTGEITSGSITFAGNDNDILVADKTTVAKTDGKFNNWNPVNIQFNHIATLVDLKVKKHTNLGNATVAITDISLEKINKTHTFRVSDAYTSTHPVVDWATGFTAGAGNTGTYTNTSGAISVATLPTDVTSDAAGDFLINSLVAMPQTFRDTGDYIQAVKISYTIAVTNGGTNTYTDVVIPLHTFDGTNDDDNTAEFKSGWAAGKHITYYLTINAHTIEFTASITGWGDVENGYHYLVN